MKATLHLYGHRGFEFQLRGIARRAGIELRPALNVVGEQMLDAERELFERRGARGGPAWEPLNPDTVERKVRAGYPFPDAPLIGEGDLLRSLSERGHQMNIFNVTRSSVFIGSTHPAAEAHAEGFVHVGGERIQARPPIRFTERDETHYAKITADWIFRGVLHA